MLCFSVLQAPWRNKIASDKQREYAEDLMEKLSDAIGEEALPKDITGGLPKRMSMKDMSGLLDKMKYFPASHGQKEALTVRQGWTCEQVSVGSLGGGRDWNWNEGCRGCLGAFQE